MAEELKRQGAVLLISCYELGHQPFGIALPMGFLERAGYAPDTMDISVEEFNPDKVRRARFAGISVPMHTALRLGVRMAERIRQLNPTCHICFYGLYASLNSEYLLKNLADSVIGGEYETPLVALVEALNAGLTPAVEGVSVPGRITKPFLKRSPMPVPSRGALPALDTYARLEWGNVRRSSGYTEASRGCIHKCLHCPIPPVYGGRFFVLPAEIVLEDIRRQVQSGATHITFGDPDFLNGPVHSLRIVRLMHEEFPRLTFDFTTKVEHILQHRVLFPELHRLGCLFIVTAVESLSDTVLAHLEKGHTRADVFTALGIVREAGIALRPSFVSFTPWTTLTDYIEMLDCVEAEGLIDHVDPVQYTIRLLIPPGSALLSRPAIHPFLGPLIQEKFFFLWRHPDPRMDALYKSVSSVVEEAARTDEDLTVTFSRVRALAYAARGDRSPGAVSPLLPHARDRAPRLTEPWFCCAEPTEGQFSTLHSSGQEGETCL